MSTFGKPLIGLELATEIAKRAPGAKVMIQVDISGEENKGGCGPDTTEDLVMHATDAGLEVIGLMGVALLPNPGGSPRLRRASTPR